MSRLVWDRPLEKTYEYGVDHGVLYVKPNGGYLAGVAWNGLLEVGIEEDSDDEKLYEHTVPYASIPSEPECTVTIRAYTYPDEFLPCMGYLGSSGISANRQRKRYFGMSYRSFVGDAIRPEAGYKIHVIYGCKVQNCNISHKTRTEKADITEFEYECLSIPEENKYYAPVTELIFDSREIDRAKMDLVESLLWGSDTQEARLPSANDLIDLIEHTHVIVHAHVVNGKYYGEQYYPYPSNDILDLPIVPDYGYELPDKTKLDLKNTHGAAYASSTNRVLSLNLKKFSAKGDVDADKWYTTNDLVMAHNALGQAVGQNDKLWRADLDGDGVITQNDIRELARKVSTNEKIKTLVLDIYVNCQSQTYNEFILDGTTYSFETNMTWADWFGSEYNVAHLVYTISSVEPNVLMFGGGDYMYNSSNEMQHTNDLIVPNMSYSIY